MQLPPIQYNHLMRISVIQVSHHRMSKVYSHPRKEGRKLIKRREGLTGSAIQLGCSLLINIQRQMKAERKCRNHTLLDTHKRTRRENRPESNTGKGTICEIKEFWLIQMTERKWKSYIRYVCFAYAHRKGRMQVPHAYCQWRLISKLGTCNTNPQREYIHRDKDSEGKPEVKNTMRPRNTYTHFFFPQEKQ